jgi:hypothetical protein
MKLQVIASRKCARSGIRFYPKPPAATRRAGKSLLEPTRISMGSGEEQLQFAHVINNEAGLAARH